MRNFLLTLVAFFVGAVAQAQTPTPEQANTRVAELLNGADYVTLAAELPAVREMVVKPLLALADALVAHCEGRFEDSNRAIEEVARYPEELGQGTVFGMYNYALINNLCIENYAQGADVARQLLSSLPDTDEAEASRRGLLSLLRWMDALTDRGRVEVVRARRDVTIPVERRPIGRGEHLIVKATANGVSQDFIFDTGCSHANFISRDVAERLGVEIVADSIITQGVGGAGYVQLGVLPEMRLGDVVIKNPTFLVAEHFIPEHVKVEGMCEAALGTHIIRALGEVRYERKAERMVLPAKPSAPTQRNLACDNGTYYLVCHQAGEQLLLHFDTGNVKSQLSTRYFARFQHQVESESGDVERSRSGGFGGVVWNDVRTLPQVELQVDKRSVMLHQVAVDISDGSSLVSYDGSAGMDLLTASERVSFDLDKMFYRIDK
ncbi:MAG: clan AA aspartic protease [Alistipes sp.]|nr:clan AA aspartic protease [Alistipes sp.]